MNFFIPQVNKPNDKVVISIRLDTQLLEHIDMISGTLNMSRNYVLVECIKYALDNFELPND